PRFQQSLKSGNLKKLDLECLFSLRLPTSQRMYRFLDKRFYPPHQPPPVEMDLHDFACGHIGLTRVDNVAELKRRLAPAIEELESIGFIAKVELAERYHKVKTGIWRVRFRAGPHFRGQRSAASGQENSQIVDSSPPPSPPQPPTCPLPTAELSIVTDFYERW